MGIASQRVLPPYAKQRFSTWFKNRARLRFAKRQGSVALFPTCLVEYQNPAIGHDVVKVYEHNGIECSLPEGQVCCGAPWLHAGDVDSFTRQAKKNIEVLSAAVRAGHDIVVPQPTCSYVLKQDYKDYVGGTDAELVATHTFDAAEYLMKIHKGDDTKLDTTFPGSVPEAVTYHAPCHLRAQNIGLKSRDLLKLTGTKVTVVAECSGIDGTWGYRAENYESARRVAKKMVAASRRPATTPSPATARWPTRASCRRPQGAAASDPTRRARLRHHEGRVVKLTLDDIADQRAYERERDAFRARIIELKKLRRIAIGPFVTIVFENRDTIRFQIQEMARAEKMSSDAAIQTELDVYNPLIPDPGSLAATLFIELTTKDDLVEWLPKLVGIERSVELRIGAPGAEEVVPADLMPSTSANSRVRRSRRRCTTCISI